MKQKTLSKSIGKYLGNGRIELNRYGCEKLIAGNIKRGEVISEKELLKRINKYLKNETKNIK